MDKYSVKLLYSLLLQDEDVSVPVGNLFTPVFLLIYSFFICKGCPFFKSSSDGNRVW